MKIAVTVLAILLLASLGCSPRPSESRAATLAGHEAALDACIATAKNHAEYTVCADYVDKQYGIGPKDGGP